MSDADSRSGRIRRREEEEQEEENDLQTAEVAQSASQLSDQPAGATAAAGSSPADPSALAAQPTPPSLSVQPLPEQFRKRQRRSSCPSCHLDKLAVVELQLCLQFLDSKSKLIAARCSRRLLQAVSEPFAWRAAVVPVAVRSPADVERICSSLLRFAPVHLRCDEMESLRTVAAVPHLVGLELVETPEAVTTADLLQLLQHPNLARLQSMRLDYPGSLLLTVDVMRLIARLPQLRTFGMTVPDGDAAGAALLQPLTDAPALTDLTISHPIWTPVGAALLRAIGGCPGLRRLCLRYLCFPSGQFLALCSWSNLRQLQHLELHEVHVDDMLTDNIDQSDNELRAAFSALEQLQSLALSRVYGVNRLLPHLHRAPVLRRLSIRCTPVPDSFSSDAIHSLLPGRAVLSALLTVASRLDVRLLMPATLDRWLALNQFAAFGNCAAYEQQWRELQRMSAEMERVTIVEEEP